MTEFELGFRRGEQDAWDGRNDPPPTPQKVGGEYARGYWAARLPRTSTWARRHDLPPAWWDESLGWYVGAPQQIKEAA